MCVCVIHASGGYVSVISMNKTIVLVSEKARLDSWTARHTWKSASALSEKGCFSLRTPQRKEVRRDSGKWLCVKRNLNLFFGAQRGREEQTHCTFRYFGCSTERADTLRTFYRKRNCSAEGRGPRCPFRMYFAPHPHPKKNTKNLISTKIESNKISVGSLQIFARSAAK